jgi:Tfp pilus assembly protein PilF
LNEARRNYEETVKAAPKSAIALNSLAWLLATCCDDSVCDGKLAVERATKLCELAAWNDPRSLHTLAAAHAEAGQFDVAVKRIKKALEHPQALGPALLEAFKERLTLYEAHKPYRQAKAPAQARRPPPGLSTAGERRRGQIS